MKVNQVILVFLGALSVDAIRINLNKDDIKIPEEIVKDAASKGLANADSATVAQLAAETGRM